MREVDGVSPAGVAEECARREGRENPGPSLESPPTSRMNQSLPLDRILLGDCRDLLRALPDECVDLVVSSPPYNLGKEYEPRLALKTYLAEQQEILTECVRILKSTGSIYWQVGAFSDRGRLVPLDIRFFPVLEDLGMIPRNRIVWIRQHGLHGRRKFSCRHETILWFTKSDDYRFDLDAIRVPQKYKNKKHHTGKKRGQLSCHPLGKNPGDIWAFRNVKHNHEERTVHPCQFPEDMISRIIRCSTIPRGIVLDPFMGAGTVAVVAKNLGRHFLGAEIDEQYHGIALRRLHGKPDAQGSFPNLKTLRQYIDTTGVSIDQFRYDVQKSARATTRRQARIFPEEHHLTELQNRLRLEEDFSVTSGRSEQKAAERKGMTNDTRGTGDDPNRWPSLFD